MKAPDGSAAPAAHEALDGRAGFALGLAAYGLWGLIPLYFRQIRTIPAWEVLAHRAWWSFVTLLVIILVLRRGPAVRAALRNPRTALMLAGSTLLIATNWLVFIYAVATAQLVQSGLGYFITPLANMALGLLVLGERLRKLQLAALVPAVAGVVYLTTQADQLPWIALTLAVSFSLYGLLRKLAAADALTGLFVETMYLTPLALAYLGYLSVAGLGMFSGEHPRESWLLAIGGPVTTLPLLCFAAAVQKLRMTTLGFLQFLAPSLQVLLAVFAFDEPFKPEYRVTFPLIWLAVAMYLVDAVRMRSSKSHEAELSAVPLEDV